MGAVPGVLRARFGAHEVIVTIMLNFIVLALLNYFVSAKLHVPETLHTPEIHAGAVPRLSHVRRVSRLGRELDDRDRRARGGAVGWFLFRTRAGYELRAVGLQPEAAEYAGVPVASGSGRSR